MNNFMTVREISELCGKTEKTVRNWVSKVFPNKMEHGNTTTFSIQEVEALFNKVFGETITAILMENARGKELPSRGKELPSTLIIGKSTKNKVEYHLIEAMKEMMKRQESLEQSYAKRVLKPEIEAPKYYTIKGWVSMNREYFGPLNKGDYISLGKKASRISKYQLYDIKFIEDETYGSVNTYHIDVLKQL